jgi:hypothetical protein
MKSIPLQIRGVELQIRQWQIFLFFMTALFFIHLPDLQLTISVDAYFRIETNPPEMELLSGRTVSYLMQLVFAALDLNIVLDQKIFFFFFLAMLSIASCLIVSCITESLEELRPTVFVSILLAILFSFSTIIFQEYFYFSEVFFLWGLGFLLAIIALRVLYTAPQKLAIPLSLFLLYLAVSTYQVWVQPFIVWGLAILIIKYRTLTKALFLQAVKLCVIGIAALLANVLVMNLLGARGVELGGRTHSFEGVLEKIPIVYQNISRTLRLYPGETVSVIVVPMLVLVALVYMVVLVRNSTQRLNRFALLTIYFTVCFIVIYGMPLFESNPTFAPRALPGISILTAFLFLFLLLELRTRKWQIPVILALVVFGLMNVVYSQSLTIHILASNRLDEREAIAIDRTITAYEEETGYKVTTLVRTFDSWYYENHPEITGRLSVYPPLRRSAYVDWSYAPAIEYYTGRTFDHFSTDAKAYDQYFEGKEWGFFNPAEQLYFVGNTVYWCLY